MRKLDKRPEYKLDVPVFQHTSMFRALGRVLRDDELFNRACEVFLDWSGTTFDEVDPSYSYCPFCRISPAPVSSNMATERQHSAPLAVAVEIAVRGTNVDNLMNFWGLIWNAVFSQASQTQFNQVSSALMTAGVTRPVMTLQGFGYSVDDQNNFMLVAQGTIVFNSLLPK